MVKKCPSFATGNLKFYYYYVRMSEMYIFRVLNLKLDEICFVRHIKTNKFDQISCI